MAVEALEPRVLLSYSLSNKLLTVTGKSTADQITFILNGTSLQLNDNGVIKSFAAGSVTKIVANAGGGNDKVTLVDAIIIPATLIGGDGNDSLRGGGRNDSLSGGNQNDRLDGGAGADTIVGGSGNDTLRGMGGADVMNGGGGVDVVDYSDRTAALTVDLDGVADDGAGGEGDNVGIDCENILSGSGNDKLTGNASDNTLRGGGGADTLGGGAGIDAAEYGDKTTKVTANLDGLANDGTSGESDLIMKDIENLIGGSAGDSLTGNTGNNGLRGGNGPDTLSGGTGIDTADYSDKTAAVTANLDGLANDGTSGEKDLVKTDVENITGGSGNDFFIGTQANNVFIGGAGANNLIGGGGGDLLIGGPQPDFLDGTNYGGSSVHVTMIGNGGNDVFVNQGTSSDVIDGGDGLDEAQEEGKDHFTNVEFFYDLSNASPGAPMMATELAALVVHQASVSGPDSNGVIYVSGTDGADRISLSQSATTLTITINGVEQPGIRLANSIISAININAEAGADKVDLMNSPSRPVSLQATIKGGNGNDTLNGGTGPDAILGGLDNDSCMGNAGGDILNGGDKVLATNDGTDVLIGGDNGADGSPDAVDYTSRTNNLKLTLDLVANDGAVGENDSIDVENIFSGKGNDDIGGDSKQNKLTGGLGKDTIHGGDELDDIVANCAGESQQFTNGKPLAVDSVFGEGGNDFLELRDLTADNFSGGTGINTREIDTNLDIPVLA